jgi:hypothetical protein
MSSSRSDLMARTGTPITLPSASSRPQPSLRRPIQWSPSCITSRGRESTWAAYQSALKKLTSVVDGVERRVVPWPDWAITTVIDAHEFSDTTWRAISCHESQMSVYTKLQNLSPEHTEALWGVQSFYRAFSRVNGGRTRETDLFEDISL